MWTSDHPAQTVFSGLLAFSVEMCPFPFVDEWKRKTAEVSFLLQLQSTTSELRTVGNNSKKPWRKMQETEEEKHHHKCQKNSERLKHPEKHVKDTPS